MPNTELMATGRAEAQPKEIAQAQARDPVRPVRSKPGRSPALRDQRGDRAVHRRSAGIAPVQIGNDDLKLVEGLVIEFPTHPASPDPDSARALPRDPSPSLRGAQRRSNPAAGGRRLTFSRIASAHARNDGCDSTSNHT